MKTARIAIDVGHTSGKDQGAVGRDGLSEHSYWSRFAPLMKDVLEKLGHEVRIFRREDHGGSVARECTVINEWRADAAISLHLNCSDNEQAGGHEVVYLGGSTRGKLLAEDIDRRLDSLSGLRDRNIRNPYNGRGDAWLTNTSCPAVIVEGGFLSNEKDVALLRQRGEEIAELVGLGVHDFFTR